MKFSSIWLEDVLFDEAYFPSLLATGDGIETVGEVTTVKVRNGMSLAFSNFLLNK